jgi:hypothetical protein
MGGRGGRGRQPVDFPCWVGSLTQELIPTSHLYCSPDPPEPPKISGYREGDQLTGGTPHRLVCSSQGGHPLATLRWFHRDTELYSEYTAGESQASALLLLTPNRTDNGAVYRCVASSRAVPPTAAAGALEAAVRLAVRYAPAGVRIDLRPSRLRQGTEAVLTCESGEANPPADLVWLLNGAPVAGEVTTAAGGYGGEVTVSRLRFTVKAEDDGSVFTCKAANSVGEALDAVTLSIACKLVSAVALNRYTQPSVFFF